MFWTVFEVELDDGTFWFTRCRACQYFSRPHRSPKHAHEDGAGHLGAQGVATNSGLP